VVSFLVRALGERWTLTIWIAQEQGRQSPHGPFVHLRGVDGVEVEQKWEGPQLAGHGDERELLEDLGNVGDEHHGAHCVAM
jgi:hypothetical protein